MFTSNHTQSCVGGEAVCQLYFIFRASWTRLPISRSYLFKASYKWPLPVQQFLLFSSYIGWAITILLSHLCYLLSVVYAWICKYTKSSRTNEFLALFYFSMFVNLIISSLFIKDFIYGLYQACMCLCLSCACHVHCVFAHPPWIQELASAATLIVSLYSFIWLLRELQATDMRFKGEELEVGVTVIFVTSVVSPRISFVQLLPAKLAMDAGELWPNIIPWPGTKLLGESWLGQPTTRVRKVFRHFARLFWNHTWRQYLRLLDSVKLCQNLLYPVLHRSDC